jgi:transposase
VPPNVTLVPLPPYSPELNPVERIWLYLRERFLSLRAFRDYRAVVDACCDTWNQHVATAAAIDLARLGDWFRAIPRAATRTSRFAALAA